MVASLLDDDQNGQVPLTAEEQRRIAALFATISTRTLLRTLANLYGQTDDTRLIVAALIDRLPADE